MMPCAGRLAITAKLCVVTLGIALAVPATAQNALRGDDQVAEAPASPPYQSSTDGVLERQRGSVASSSVGQVGQRQTREQEIGGIQATRRINSRIANRVQSRLRTRIDRHYDPQANAASPFEAATDEIRGPGQPR